ncbi:MAG: sigma-70 family RNA polymerase sigma factor [Lachnospiraceae bacterium]|nr:sigma-70 family RNA polymerase sigma factor [Lachnospiraceae bacterium]
MRTKLPNSDVSTDKDLTTKLDAVLFQQIAEGNKDAFRILYEQTYQSIYVYLLSIVQNKEEAEDLLQETFIRVRLYVNRYSDQGKPLAWMFTIARNLAYMRLRELKKKSFQEFETIQDMIGFSLIQNVEDRIVLEGAFQVLNDEERSIVLLHAVSGMKHKEIASILNKPLSTVLSKYNRAIKKLNQELSNNGKE